MLSPVRQEPITSLNEWCFSCQANRSMQIRHQAQLETGCHFTICSEVSTHCPDRHKATEACLVYQKISYCQNHLFLHKPGLTERKDWSCPIFSLILSCFWQIGMWELKHIRPDYSPVSHMDHKTSTPGGFFPGGRSTVYYIKGSKAKIDGVHWSVHSIVFNSIGL